MSIGSLPADGAVPVRSGVELCSSMGCCCGAQTSSGCSGQLDSRQAVRMEFHGRGELLRASVHIKTIQHFAHPDNDVKKCFRRSGQHFAYRAHPYISRGSELYRIARKDGQDCVHQALGSMGSRNSIRENESSIREIQWVRLPNYK